MATAAQVTANKNNAQKSTGPTSPAGKQASSQNRTCHGLAGGVFFLQEGEEPMLFERLLDSLPEEHRPQTITEKILVDKMAQHHWLSERAQRYQSVLEDENPFAEEAERHLKLFLRYEAHHQRLFHRALNDLLKLRAERRKAEIGLNRRSAPKLRNSAATRTKIAKSNGTKRPLPSIKPSSNVH